MSIREPHKDQVEALVREYWTLSKGRENFLKKIAESEVAEGVYNSNAIENSTLTLNETETILFESIVSKHLDLREVLEAKNLAQVYLLSSELTEATLLSAHALLLRGIQNDIAGRFRQKGENVRIANHVAPVAEKIPKLMEDLLLWFRADERTYFLEKIAKFHLDFERIHPFCDGNGRMGRILINWQLQQLDYPPVIIRNKDKKHYYAAFRDFNARGKTQKFEKMLVLALLESLHKRLALLKGLKIIPLADWARATKASPITAFNAAKRQSLPAFRQNEVWMIGKT